MKAIEFRASLVTRKYGKVLMGTDALDRTIVNPVFKDTASSVC
ncbi:hypothetical protein [Adhaeribacter pallidiroseus]|uniref:Uncharacterized protein n=1 Tax=Adhaeribacter pallidiroseus TaxID=2072847 RepID=A0A369QSE5_9BACT|nr:hypothetical protein [Adhaeribacter pallidiroseus]RDC66246.1 hypothetical protein AHMF7616_04877 [Adhaeribacter pallidiroseus]